MNLCKTLALCSVLLLGGCGDEAFMTVRFETKMGTARWGVDQYSGDLINKGLEQRHIDPKSLRFDVDAEDEQRVHVYLLQPLDAQQQSDLRGLFEEVVQARNAVTMDIEVTLQPTEAERKRLTPEQVKALQAMPPSFTLPARLGKEVSTVAAMPGAWPGATMDISERVEAEVSCQLYVNLQNYYPGMSDIYPAAGTDPQRVILEFGETSESGDVSDWTVSAYYRFKEASVQRQVDQGELKLVPADEQNDGETLSIAFKLADLGEQRIMRAHQIDASIRHLNFKCSAEEDKLGRPYTFFLGNGLDRVESVTYPPKS